MQLRVLITGVSGFMGRELCEAFIDNGYGVVGLGRSSQVDMQNSVDYRACDLLDVDLSKVITGGFDAVIHLANLAHGKGSSRQQIGCLHAVNVDSTLRVAEHALKDGVRRFVFVSSIGVHGASIQGARITEDSPLRPSSDYARSKLDAEIALTNLFGGREASQLVIVRPPLVYGTGAPGNFRSLLGLASSRLPLPFGGCNNRRSVISISNLVTFLMTCVDHPRASGEIFVVSDGNVVSTKQIVSSLRRGMKRRSNLFPSPPSVMKIGLGLVGRAAMY